MPRPLATIIAVPVAAQISVQPLLLVFQSTIPTYGILANALADPLAPVATIAGLLSLVCAPITPLAVPLAWVAWCASSLIAWIARTVAALPFASIPWPVGATGITLALVCTVLLAWALIVRRRILALSAGAIAAVALSTTVGGGAVAWATAPTEWSIAQCDVGQGDAVVLRDGASVAVVDTGRDERLFRDCLSRLGVTHITLLVLTHFDIDHAGAYAVARGMTDTVVHGPTDGIADDITLRELAQSGATLVDGTRGITGQLGDWQWRVLWPTGSIPVEPGNPSSVVVSLRDPENRLPSVLDLGDLPAREQEMMAELGGLGRIDVVKVSHHGSRDQFPGLYERLHAGLALVGVGADNEYGHPTDQTLAMLKSVGSAVVRSDLNGAALIERVSTGALRVWTERAGWPAVN
jgi:competence protein ComEC